MVKQITESRIELRLPRQLKSSLESIAILESKKVSEVVREAMVQYVKKYNNI